MAVKFADMASLAYLVAAIRVHGSAPDGFRKQLPGLVFSALLSALGGSDPVQFGLTKCKKFRHIEVDTIVGKSEPLLKHPRFWGHRAIWHDLRRAVRFGLIG